MEGCQWIAQVGIAFFGVTAIFLVGTKGKYQKWAYVCGMLSQPFWFWASISNQQWGIFALSFFYAFSWFNGFRNHFFNS